MSIQPFVSIEQQHHSYYPGAKAASEPHQETLTDRVFRRLALSGVGIELLSALFGLSRDAVEQRAAALNLPKPHDRPMRKAGPRGWTIETVRQFITLWIENVATKCIVAAVGRSTGSLYSKRKRLGLEPRKRGELQERSPDACAATPISWLPRALTDIVVTPIKRALGIVSKKPKRGDIWTPERSLFCSHLAFAGLSNAAIANIATAEFGISYSAQAVADQLSRVQAFRDRTKKAVEFVPEDEIMPRAERFIKLWLLQWRVCEGTGHHFWYSRVRGGSRKTCREFSRSKFASKRQERDCTAHFTMP